MNTEKTESEIIENTEENQQAAEQHAEASEEHVEREKQYIDPIYLIYSAQVISEIESLEFYDFFIQNLERGKREFEFSNRKLEKSVDETWVKAIEDTLDAFREITQNPRNFIREQEEIVNVAVARQSTPDVIRHLTTHGNYIDEVNEDNVRPNHLLNKFKEDSWNTYENRFVYTLLEKTVEFVNKRYDAIFANLGDEFGAFLKVNAEATSKTDIMSTKIDIRLKQMEDTLADDDDDMDIYKRIVHVKEMLDFFNSGIFAKTLRRYPRVKNPIVKTNAIRKNPNFKACYLLWVFLHNYHEIGYKISIFEQDSTISPTFEHDIYHSIFFNYIILKNYLADPEDREIDTSRKFKKRVIKPRFIKKIVEEIVKNYDMTDVEVRKVLIDELNKEQLMAEQAAERRELLETQQRELAAKRRLEQRVNAQMQRDMQMERIRKIREKDEELKERRQLELAHKQKMDSCMQSYLYDLQLFDKQREKITENRGLA